MSKSKQNYEDTISEMSGGKSFKKTSIAETLSQSGIGEGVRKAKSIFKKAFKF